jgi:hypothetical protein
MPTLADAQEARRYAQHVSDWLTKQAPDIAESR